MDFNIRKISHLFALFVVCVALVLLIVTPALSFFGIFPSMGDSEDFRQINLDAYIDDPNYEDKYITWTNSTTKNLTVEIDNRVARVYYSANWEGSETITFTAENPNGTVYSDEAEFTIIRDGIDSISVDGIPDQEILEGGEFEEISLDDYVKSLYYSVSQMNWSYYGNSHLQINIENRIATVSYPENWNGSETVSFVVTGPFGIKDTEQVTFTVRSDGNLSVLKDINGETLIIQEIPEYAILLSSAITVFIFLFVPLLWYKLVNRFSIKQALYSLKLRSEKIDSAFLWGILAAIAMLVIVIIMGLILYAMGYSEDELSNVEELAGNISIASMIFIIIFQSAGEEIFFRGFLLEKIESYAGSWAAIIITSIIFGIAHMSYGKVYPVIMPMIMGLLLGYIVIKIKNLYAAITAHLLFNLTVFLMYLFVQPFV